MYTHQSFSVNKNHSNHYLIILQLLTLLCISFKPLIGSRPTKELKQFGIYKRVLDKNDTWNST